MNLFVLDYKEIAWIYEIAGRGRESNLKEVNMITKDNVRYPVMVSPLIQKPEREQFIELICQKNPTVIIGYSEEARVEFNEKYGFSRK